MKRKGFTFIELIVALGIFTAVLAIAVGGFARALHAQKEAAALIAVQANAGITLEQIAREMRTGYLFCVNPTSTAITGQQTPWTAATPPDCSTSCQANSSTLSSEPWTCNGFLHFYNANGTQVIYSLAGGALLRNGSPVIGTNVHVTYLNFTLFGQLLEDHWNPRITVTMGVAPSTTDPAIANAVVPLETTISARVSDSGVGFPY